MSIFWVNQSRQSKAQKAWILPGIQIVPCRAEGSTHIVGLDFSPVQPNREEPPPRYT